MMSKPDWKQKFRYGFDTFISRHPWSTLFVLLAIFIALLVLMTIMRNLVHLIEPIDEEGYGGFWPMVYHVFLQLADPGGMASDIERSAWSKFVAVLSGISGLIIFGSLTAFITSALMGRLDRHRQGRSRVVESGHTLILGLNNRTIELIDELKIANIEMPDERLKKGDSRVVVVLSPEGKVRLEDQIRSRTDRAGNVPWWQYIRRQRTRIVERIGDSALTGDLERMSLSSARSVVVLAHTDHTADDDDMQASDAMVIRSCLAVEQLKQAKNKEDKRPIVVAELLQERSRKVLESRERTVYTFNGNDLLAKLIVQASRSEGLAKVWTELLSFKHAEMYIYTLKQGEKDWGEGKTFGDLAYGFTEKPAELKKPVATPVPIGIYRKKESDKESDTILINPKSTEKMKKGDQAIVVAMDDSTIEYSHGHGDTMSKKFEMCRGNTINNLRPRKKETILVIGWNSLGETIVKELKNYVERGSNVVVMTSSDNKDQAAEIRKLDIAVPEIEVEYVGDKDPNKPEDLQSMELHRYGHIILLSQKQRFRGSMGTDASANDAGTILTLLQLRQVLDKSSVQPSSKLIVEIQNSDNEELLRNGGRDNDFIVSNKLISKMLAQISEDPGMRNVYREILKEESSELYIKPMSCYPTGADNPKELQFGDLMMLAQRRLEVCIGVKLKVKSDDITLIPEKTKLFKLADLDGLIVFADNEQ
ncbi:MAG: NAD-binding protein [Phycisphaerales bacterium]|nr:NAD-binding protein [Phycisphaerales bacterium]